MSVEPFNAKRLNDIYSVYTISDLTKPEGFCSKIANKITWVNAPCCFSTNPDKVFENTIIFGGIVPKHFIENQNVILIVKDAAKFYRDYLINGCCNSLHLFSGSIHIGIYPRWKTEISTLYDPCETTLEYTEKSLANLSRTEITNLRKVVRLIIDNFEDKLCDECAYYTQLFCALSFENGNRKHMFMSPPELPAGLSPQDLFPELSDFIDRINNRVSSYNMGVPMIERVVYNAPNTVVFWKDGTSTTVAATEGEEFNKEIGLAMAIARKYFAVREDNPRAAFKNVVKNADDYTAASEHKRQQKERKIQKKIRSAFNNVVKNVDESKKKLESENGHDADI